MPSMQGDGCAVSACRAFLLYSAYMRAAGWIAEKVRKAKELILRRSQPEPVQEEVQPEMWICGRASAGRSASRTAFMQAARRPFTRFVVIMR